MREKGREYKGEVREREKWIYEKGKNEIIQEEVRERERKKNEGEKEKKEENERIQGRRRRKGDRKE